MATGRVLRDAAVLSSSLACSDTVEGSACERTSPSARRWPATRAGSWLPAGDGKVCDLGVETLKADEPVHVAYLHQRDQVRIGPVHAPLPVVLQGAAQECLVVDDHRCERQGGFDETGYLVPGSGVRALEDVDDLGHGEIGKHETARWGLDQGSGGAGRHLWGLTGEVAEHDVRIESLAHQFELS